MSVTPDEQREEERDPQPETWYGDPKCDPMLDSWSLRNQVHKKIILISAKSSSQEDQKKKATGRRSAAALEFERRFDPPSWESK